MNDVEPGAGTATEPEETEIESNEDVLESIVEIEENEYDEPIHYPPENALPDAPLHVRADENGLTEAPDGPEIAVESEEEADIPAETEELIEVSEHLAEEAEDQPAVASLLDDDEDRDIQAMILGDVEGIEIEQPEEGAAVGEAAAESGSASVRERGGRFPHRVSRRRRRGRPQGPSEAGD